MNFDADPLNMAAIAALPKPRVSPYGRVLAETLKITTERARLVEAYLRLQFGTLSHLSREDFRHEYTDGGISDTIDADTRQAIALAESFGI